MKSLMRICWALLASCLVFVMRPELSQALQSSDLSEDNFIINTIQDEDYEQDNSTLDEENNLILDSSDLDGKPILIFNYLV